MVMETRRSVVNDTDVILSGEPVHGDASLETGRDNPACGLLMLPCCNAVPHVDSLAVPLCDEFQSANSSRF